MEGWQIALVVLVAVLVGALIPLIVQLYGTLHTLRAIVEKSAKDVEAGLQRASTGPPTGSTGWAPPWRRTARWP